MGGSSTETVRNMDVVPLTQKIGAINKALMLDDFKKIPSGMRAVTTSRAMTMANMRGKFNSGFLQNLGYAPNSTIQYKSVDEDLLLDYLQVNLNSGITGVTNFAITFIELEDLAYKYLQDNYSFNLTDKCILHNSVLYRYDYIVENGNYIDIAMLKNANDTANDYLSSSYTNYMIIELQNEPITIDGIKYFICEFEYTYTQIETICDENGQNCVDEEVEYIETLTINIPAVYHYFQIPNTKKEFADVVASQHTGVYNYTFETTDEYGTIHSTSARFDVVVIATSADTFYITAAAQSTAWYNNYSYLNKTVKNVKTEEVQNSLIQSYRSIVTDYYLNGKLYRYYNAIANISQVITNKTAEVLPIVPLKRGGNIVNSQNMKIVLNQIGLKIEDFKQSLSDSIIKEAYFFFSADWNDTSATTTKLLFETFFNMVLSKVGKVGGTTYGGGGVTSGFSVSYANLALTYNLTINTKIVSGTIGTTGSYQRSGNIFRKQETNDFYWEITINSIKMSYTVNGIQFKYGSCVRSSYIGDSGGCIDDFSKMRIIVPRDALMRLNFKEYVDSLEKVMSLMVYTVQTYKVKWYQSGFWSFVFTAIAIYITVASWGTMKWTLAAVLKIVAVMAISYAILHSNLPVWLKVVSLVALSYYSGMFNGDNGQISTMKLASGLVQITNQVSQVYFESSINKMQQNISQLQYQNEKANEELEKLTENIGAGLFFFEKDIDTYYDISYGNLQYNYDILYDYDSLYDIYN